MVGSGQLEVALEQDTVWLSQAQMVELFGRDQSVVSRHIRNALTEGEVAETNNMQKRHIACLDIWNLQMAGKMFSGRPVSRSEILSNCENAL